VTPSEERDLRHQLDGAIGRALVDRDYAAELLARPREKLGIHEVGDSYTTLPELAQHLLRLFWPAPVASQRASSSGSVRVILELNAR
jgi:hypothetical protein